MRGDLSITISALFSFLLVLARVSGVFAFTPLPGFRTSPMVPRVILSVALSVALLPLWPKLSGDLPGFGTLLGWIAAEAALGMMIGLAVAFLAEAFLLAMQVLGLQAGYSYASTIDPSSDADSGVLQVLGQLAANLLFFVLGLDHEVIRVMSASLRTHAPGAFLPQLSSADAIIHLGAQIFITGLRLALPVVALLLLVDIALALTGRIHAQLQLLSIAFPVKMLTALGLLAVLSAVIPLLYQQAATRTFAELRSLIR